MRFTTILRMELTGKTHWGRPEYRLTGELVYADRVGVGTNLIVCVPRDFPTDLASSPWGFRWLLAKWPEPAVLHDYLCTLPECNRFLADAIFRDAMASQGVPLWRRVVAYYAVRFFAIITGKR